MSNKTRISLDMIDPKPMSGDYVSATYAPLISPTLIGVPKAPTANQNTNTDQIATTRFVKTAISDLVNGADSALDTLNELATALGNDPNFATTMANELGTKLNTNSADYVKSLSINGKNITVTKGNNTTSTLVTQDTVYTHPTTAGNKHIPSGGSSGQVLKWKADGEAQWGTDNDTHYTTHLYAGSGTAANATTTNGNTKLTVVDNSSVRNTVTIKGTGATSVTSDANGNITISSTDTNTVTTVTSSGNGNAVTSITASNGKLTVKKDSTFSLSNHTHSYTPLAKSKGSNINPIYTDSNGAIQSCKAPTSGAWFTAIPQINSSGVTELGKYLDFHISNTGTTDYDVRLTATSGQLACSGTLSATKVVGAYYADYAEWFPKGEETEPGDVIALNLNSDKESYIKSSEVNNKVVGVHSDNYSHIIGGSSDIEHDNNIDYIPVALAGRIRTKVVGHVHKGDYLVPSAIPGVARVYNEKIDSVLSVFSMLVEDDDLDFEVRRLNVKLMR